MNSLTIDTFFNGRLEVKQHRHGYRFSIDAVLLANHARPRSGDKVLDLGTGCGIIPLILSYRYPDIMLYGVEIQEELARLASSNIEENDMGHRVSIFCEDIKVLTPEKISGHVQLVVSNPPYRKAKSGRINPEKQRATARHEIQATLYDIVEAASRLLQISGRFLTIYPAERITDLLAQMRSSQIEPKRLRIIHSHSSAEAKLILVEGAKGGRPGVKVAPPLTIYNEDGSYTDEVTRMFQQ